MTHSDTESEKDASFPEFAKAEEALLNSMDYMLGNGWQRLDQGKPSKELLNAYADLFTNVADKLMYYLTSLLSQDTDSHEVRKRFSGTTARLLMDLHRYQDGNVKQFPEWYEEFAREQENWPVLCPPQEQKRNEITKEIISSLRVGQGRSNGNLPSFFLDHKDPMDLLCCVQQLARYQRIDAFPARWGYSRCPESYRITLSLPSSPQILERLQEAEKSGPPQKIGWKVLAGIRKKLKQYEEDEFDLTLEEMGSNEDYILDGAPVLTQAIPTPPFTRESYEIWLSDFLMPNYDAFPELFLNHPSIFQRRGGPDKGEHSKHRQEVKSKISRAVKRVKSLQAESL
jgi:hypothetical protein